MSCLPTTGMSSDVEMDYRANILPSLILPMWDYRAVPGTQPTSLGQAMGAGYAAAGRAAGVVADPFGAAGFDAGVDRERFERGRKLGGARLLAEVGAGGPLTDAAMRRWHAGLDELKDTADDPEITTVLAGGIPGIPFLDRTSDKYELLTWQWLQRRLRIEEDRIALQAVRLIPCILLQFLCAGCLWGLGSTEVDGGRIEVVVASFCVGVVAVLSGIVGLLGVLAENELFLRCFWVSQLWTLSLLVAFLYVEAHHVQQSVYACNPRLDLVSNPDNRKCNEATAINSASMIVCCLEIFLSFSCVYMTTALMDALNDKTTLHDVIDVFKYLQYYTNELMKRVGQLQPGQSGPNYVDPLLGPVRTKNADGLWVTEEDCCEEVSHEPDAVS
ncbi:hypothetical protein DIPPA_21106 [Diplonema papillatum]|nr:hypothetical protein DIPPA_21106 [Diplonema papillatum]